MVYGGKPSSGCQCCKTRRIKCDEARPTCGNCRKSGRECPGYLDEFDLNFRNETAAVKRRLAKALPSGNRASPTASSSSSSTSEKSGSPKSLKAKTPTLLEPFESVFFASPEDELTAAFDALKASGGDYFQRAVEDPEFPFLDLDFAPADVRRRHRANIDAGLEYCKEATAVAFFFRNFVVVPPHSGCSRGFLEYLNPMYNRTSPDSALHLATQAASLAALSQYPGNHRLKTDASRAYGLALSKINGSIRSGPARASTDENLITVLVLSLYEACHGDAITSQGSPSAETAWSSHIDGAVALARLRRADGWQSEESVGLFRAVRWCALTNAIQRGKPIPEFPGTKGWSCDDNFETNAANRLTLVSLGLPQMRCYALDVAMLPPGTQKDKESMNLVQMAQETDTRLEQWYRGLDRNWAHRTVDMQLEEPKDVHNAPRWQGPVHVYGNLVYSNIVNDYRVSRVFCNQIMLAACGMLSEPALQHSIREIQVQARYEIGALADDICSSVPFHMDLELQTQGHEGGTKQHVPAAEVTGAYFLCWPLYVVAHLECISPSQREWAEGRLYRVGKSLGLHSGQIMAMAEQQVISNGPKFP